MPKFNKPKTHRNIQLPEHLKNASKKDFKFVDFNYARYKVQQLKLSSLRQYQLWHKTFKPSGFPHDPHMYYKDNGWISWLDFLSTNNYYIPNNPNTKKDHELLPFWEAAIIVHQLKISSPKKYWKAWDDNLIPHNIPRNPQDRYKDFYDHGGFPAFLGRKVQHKVKAASSVQPLLAIGYTSEQSKNILSILISKQGEADLIQMIKDNKDFNTVKVFKYDTELQQTLIDSMNHFGILQYDNAWLFHSVNDIIFELSMLFSIHTFK